jgi:hypothetical protein
MLMHGNTHVQVMFRVVLVLTLLGAMAAAGGEGSDQESLTLADCERVVEQLANPGKPPFTEVYVLDLPKGVRESDLRRQQQTIAEAYNALSANIEVAFPVLAAHIADKRFSYVYEDGVSGVYECETVGGACRRIIDEHVAFYEELVAKRDDDGRAKSVWFAYDKAGGMEKWLKDRQGRSLAELQLEAVEWAVAQPQHDFFSPAEWEAAKKSLHQAAKQLRDTKKPIHVEHRVQFFSK